MDVNPCAYRLVSEAKGWLSLVTDPERWPLLARSVRNLRQAYSTKIEWVYETPPRYVTCDLGHKHLAPLATNWNYTQIFRTPILVGDSKKERLHEHYDEIEKALRSGMRYSSTPYTRMGGVLDLLGRWPHKNDTLVLCVLRETVLLDNGVGGEWLTELSLQATKGSDDGR